MLVARVTIGPGRWSKRGRRRVWEAKGVQPVTVFYSLLFFSLYLFTIIYLASCIVKVKANSKSKKELGNSAI